VSFKMFPAPKQLSYFVPGRIYYHMLTGQQFPLVFLGFVSMETDDGDWLSFLNSSGEVVFSPGYSVGCYTEVPTP